MSADADPADTVPPAAAGGDGATDYAALVGLAERHTLELAGHSRKLTERALHETRWLRERDADARLVARYRTWLARSSQPPYRTQFGWERWSLDGRLLDREVRYSTRHSRRALH